MRFNRVESFYVFLLYFRSKRNEEDGRPATASPGCGQGPLQRGDWLWPRPPTQGAVGCRATPTKDDRQRPAFKGLLARRGSAHPWPGHKGRLPVLRPQGQHPPVTVGPTMSWQEITMHGDTTILARLRRLARGEMDLKMGNGARVAAIAIGEVILHLPGGVFVAFILFCLFHY
ncbi:hypothetical protein B296_00027941 [Ensete ventricosum]|uniref:Uncharacterized protein n=1 Tax=Ensete ventricosum TaxID=4639 RepID=A0A426XSK5_ENSVE|nr:hypothetical protein B296_00027941 [Ensete ventricosum]